MKSTYNVNSESFDNYLKKVRKSWIKTVLIISLIITMVYCFIIYSTTQSIFTVVLLVTILPIITFSAVYSWSNQLKDFRNANYILLDDSIEMYFNKTNINTIRFSEIRVIHSRFLGTLLITGGQLIKIRYILSQLGSLTYLPWLPLLKENQIFIPNNISEYQNLIGLIQERSVESYKIGKIVEK